MATKVLPAGTTLYHASRASFHLPDRPTWLATDIRQSVYFIKEGLVYIYKTTRDLRLVDFKTNTNMYQWAKNQRLPPHEYAFTTADKILAKHLCSLGEWDGWWFPDDQKQVMLCNPRGALKLVKKMEVEFPYGHGSLAVNRGRYNKYILYMKDSRHRFNLSKIHYKVGNAYFNYMGRKTSLPWNKAPVNFKPVNNVNLRAKLPPEYRTRPMSLVVLRDKNKVNNFLSKMKHQIGPKPVAPWYTYKPVPERHPKHMNINLSNLFKQVTIGKRKRQDAADHRRGPKTFQS